MRKIFEQAALTTTAIAVVFIVPAHADSDDLNVDSQQQSSRDGSAMMSGFARITRTPLTNSGNRFFQFLTGAQQHSSDIDDKAKRSPNSMLGMLSKLDALNCLGVNPGWRQPFSSKSKTETGASTEVMPNTEMSSVPVTHEVSVTTTTGQSQSSDSVILRPEMK